MSMQVRVCVEIAESVGGGGPLIRAEQIETIVPANNNAGDWSDIEALGHAALERLIGECHEKAQRQLGQIAALLPGGRT